MWLKLMASKNIGSLLQPTFKNGHWRPPVIRGAQRRELREYFYKAGVPWIYDKPVPEVKENSPYNQPPDRKEREMNKEVRLATIRKNMSQMDQKLEKLR